MTDINKQIEEALRSKIKNFKNSTTIFDTRDYVLIDDAIGIVDSFIDSSRWRKVSEDEFPEIDTPILCKFRVGSMQPSIQYRVSALLKSGRFSGETDWVSVVEWKHID